METLLSRECRLRPREIGGSTSKRGGAEAHFPENRLPTPLGPLAAEERDPNLLDPPAPPRSSPLLNPNRDHGKEICSLAPINGEVGGGGGGAFCCCQF